MRTRLNMFMLGRNGVDFLNKHLFCIAAVIAGVNLLFSGWVGVLPPVMAGYALFRTLSRNLPMRQMEDMVVREKYGHAKEKISGALQRAKQSRDYRLFFCPSCGSYLRVPRGKGRIQVTCPRCGHRFDRKS